MSANGKKVTKATRSNSPGRNNGVRVVKARVAKNDEAEVTEEVHFEFGGPVGALSIIVGLPMVIFVLYFTCHTADDGKDICMSNPLTFPYAEMLRSIPTTFSGWFPREAVVLYTSWMVLQLVLERILPGELAEGVPIQEDGGRCLKYTLSGHLQFWISLLLMGHSIPKWTQSAVGVWSISGLGRVPLELIYDYYLQVAAASVVGATVLSIYL